MCGIAGLWRRNGGVASDGQRLARMAQTLRHRGPDDYGYLLADSRSARSSLGQTVTADFVPDVLLASRRLSIIDLSARGRQPIANETGDVFVVFNGAIHNHEQLRAQLERMGHVFRSQTDTEVIVHAYEAWGPECALRFNGMWAYAIWDQRKRRLVCSRDRFAVKPLYVAERDGTFYFASEIKALVAAGVPAAINPAAVARCLARAQVDPAQQTLFAHIRPVPAAHNLIVTQGGIEELRYWSYSGHEASYDRADPEGTFRELFRDSLRLRLRADVPVGLLLSGGMDSSTIAAFAVRETNTLRAFTAIFPGFSSNEQGYAQLVAKRAGIPLECVEYRPGRIIDDLTHLAWHMETPLISPQVLPRWALLRAAGAEVKVVLEGQGADELLAGYQGYFKHYVFDELAALRLANVLGTVSTLLPVAQWVVGDQWRAARKWIDRRLGRVTAPAGAHILSGELVSLADGSPLPRSGPFPDRLTNALWWDHHRRILPHLLSFGDSIAMAHSVESRVPYLDHRLVEFVFGLSYRFKIKGGISKQLLRRALGAELPPEILARRTKVGFSTPSSTWLRAEFGSSVRPILDSKEVRERGLFDMVTLRAQLDSFESGKDGAENLLMRCLSTELWCRQFIDGAGFIDP